MHHVMTAVRLVHAHLTALGMCGTTVEQYLLLAQVVAWPPLAERGLACAATAAQLKPQVALHLHRAFKSQSSGGKGATGSDHFNAVVSHHNGCASVHFGHAA
jgi:hypothetical protein